VSAVERFLIVNADDFGRSPGINDGVVRAHREGIVTSTSLMVRWPAAVEAARYAREHPELSVGLHVDLGEWSFRDGEWVLEYEVVPEDDADAMRAEVEAQLARFRALLGRPPTHLDAHQHVHRSGVPGKVVRELGGRLGVPVRFAHPHLRSCGDFYGQTGTGDPLAGAVEPRALASIVGGLPDGWTELICHPAADALTPGMYGTERRAELDSLCDPGVRAAVESAGIALRSFTDLAVPAANGHSSNANHEKESIVPRTQTETDDRGTYGRYWDYYVERFESRKAEDANGELEWPGDEWGSPAAWKKRFDGLFPAARIADWHRAVEIGPGSGKYTLKLLEESAAEVRGYDVSERFLEVCRERCQEHVGSGRLGLHRLAAVDPGQLLDDLRDAGWARRVDGFYSIDVMVHIDLQYLVVYWMTAGMVLRPGGHLVMTLNDVTHEPGFEKLMRDISWTFPSQGRALGSGKFEWLSPDIIASVLPRIGFRIEKLVHNGRDLEVVAELVEPERADALEVYLRPPA
jgi:chitin disaccharide deacetylase